MSTLTVSNPHDLSPLQEIPLQGAQEVESALDTADRLYRDRSQWLPAYQRIEILERTAALMTEQIDELARLACSEGGKPWADTLVEVHRAIQGVKLATEHISQIKGEQIPMDQTAPTAGRIAYTVREPIGPVVSVSAFNHPLNLIIHQTVPAIAAGCPVIIKPANNTPLSCLRFVAILHQAGLPPEWCQALVCERTEAQQLVTDPRTAFFSFIGSGKVGWYLRSQLAPGTRCALEHGGAAPVIVAEDADIDDTVTHLLKGGFYHAGQVCVSVQRIFAHHDIIDELAEKLSKGAEKLTQGDPLDPTTEVGPLILPGEVTRVHEWVTEAISEGAECLTGGSPLSETHYPPTVLLRPSASSTVSTSEIFGPVVCLYSYTEINDAIARANSLPYAFQAAVFTNNIHTAQHCATELDATAVMINDHTAYRADWMPFGGRKESGLGLGGIPHSIHEMTQEKLIVTKLR